MGMLGVEVDDALIRIKFGVGLFRKSFRLDEIETCRPVRNRWWWAKGSCSSVPHTTGLAG
jgi:hypothetical protein